MCHWNYKYGCFTVTHAGIVKKNEKVKSIETKISNFTNTGGNIY